MGLCRALIPSFRAAKNQPVYRFSSFLRFNFESLAASNVGALKIRIGFWEVVLVKLNRTHKGILLVIFLTQKGILLVIFLTRIVGQHPQAETKLSTEP